MNVDDILPAVVHFGADSSQAPRVGCHIGGVYYSNKDQTSLKDTNYATLVYDKETGQVFVTHQQPEFLGPCFDDSRPSTSTTPAVADRAALTQAFGSVRKQRMLKEFERHADHRAAATHATVISRAMHGQQAIKPDDEIGDKSKATKPVDERSRLLPRFDVNASCPQDIFPFDKLIPRRVLETLAPEVDGLVNATISSIHTWSQKATYPKCILDRLLKFIDMSGTGTDKLSSNRMKILQGLAFLSHMLALFHLSSHGVQRKEPLPDTPQHLSKHLLQEFTAMINRGDSGRLKIRTISPLLRDRLIYHMLVVILHCDNFSTIIDELAVDFRMGAEKLRRYFTYLGCRIAREEVKAEGNSSTTRLRATMTAPIHFPDAGTTRNKRRNFVN